MGEKNWEEKERKRGKPRKENTFGDYTIYMTIDIPILYRYIYISFNITLTIIYGHLSACKPLKYIALVTYSIQILLWMERLCLIIEENDD